MSQIAERLGGSKATLWTYFSSKEDLFRHVVDSASMELQRELVIELDQSDILEEALLRFCRQLIESVVSPDAAAIRYERAVLNALSDSETAINRFASTERTASERNQARDDAREALQLARTNRWASCSGRSDGLQRDRHH